MFAKPSEIDQLRKSADFCKIGKLRAVVEPITDMIK